MAESSRSTACKILIGIIVGVSTTVGVDVVSNFSILAVLRWTWSFFTDYHLLPGWVLIAVSTLAIMGLVAIAKSWGNAEERGRARSLVQVMHYTTDTFYGVKWRWSYADGGEITNLAMFCPECDIQLSSCNPPHVRNVNTCGRCGAKCLDPEMATPSACNNVPLEIQRKMRAGEHELSIDSPRVQ